MTRSPKDPSAVSGLDISMKGRFPFRFGSTSYLHPADIETNIRRAGGLMDEMELILFEGKDYSNLPTPADVKLFSALAAETGLRFNVHLPLDVDVTAAEEEARIGAVDAVLRIVDLAAPLSPTGYPLHLPREASEDPKRWEERARRSLARLSRAGAPFCVETLSYDLREIDDALREHRFPVCIDIGHLLMGGYDIPDFFRVFRDRIPMIHLHGVRDGKDHASVHWLSAAERRVVAEAILGEPSVRSVSLEVFSLEDWADSAETLEEMFGHGREASC
jgi:sugar phosphate isomerase/epimerase